MRMRLLLLAVAGAMLASGCAIVSYDKFEGKQLVREGEGGTKATVDGIDVWNYGAPPRRYEVMGIVTVTVPTGPVAQSRITSNAAEKAKEMGGSAAVALDGSDPGMQTFVSTALGSNGSYATGTGVSVGRATGRYLVVKYLD